MNIKDKVIFDCRNLQEILSGICNEIRRLMLTLKGDRITWAIFKLGKDADPFYRRRGCQPKGPRQASEVGPHELNEAHQD